ncbi:hypothetical protein OPT61_g9532 [Boeremia exigua]|uniref:Uncharacterized protein n=1 Tax=Boeremia exigua TaxID=749465 RepID=A0ACC2HTR8_9PLEO|nr:hypothetical protein OPT61_g9532 [Boeremia exigua]
MYLSLLDQGGEGEERNAQQECGLESEQREFYTAANSCTTRASTTQLVYATRWAWYANIWEPLEKPELWFLGEYPVAGAIVGIIETTCPSSTGLQFSRHLTERGRSYVCLSAPVSDAYERLERQAAELTNKQKHFTQLRYAFVAGRGFDKRRSKSGLLKAGCTWTELVMTEANGNQMLAKQLQENLAYGEGAATGVPGSSRGQYASTPMIATSIYFPDGLVVGAERLLFGSHISPAYCGPLITAPRAPDFEGPSTAERRHVPRVILRVVHSLFARLNESCHKLGRRKALLQSPGPRDKKRFQQRPAGMIALPFTPKDSNLDYGANCATM